MSPRHTVIYTARTAQDAHFLKNLLANARIEALVVNDTLDLGAGSNPWGWSTSPRVLVAEEDAPRARQIALEFDREAAASAAGPGAEGPEPEAPSEVSEDWPRCPGCGAPRSTRCPVCGTAGSDFRPADMGFTWIPDPEDTAYRPPPCSCGPGGCTPAGGETAAPAGGEAAAPSGDETAASDDDQSQAERPAELLMCPTCDEPFPPQYPRLCEWCGHEFADGFEVQPPAEPVEQITGRVIAVIVGLVLLAVAIAVYFTLIAY